MSTSTETKVTKDVTNKKLVIVREFDAPLAQVWKAWTEKEQLDLRWAPKPWRAETKTMDFKEGGLWLYSMVAPDGTDSYCRVDFKIIVAHKSFVAEDSFCDQQGNDNPDFPHMLWKTEFSELDGVTNVTVKVSFENEADLRKILEMGFEEGFTAALCNLDELLVK